MSVLWYPTIKQAPLPGLVGMGGGADALTVLGGGDPDKGKQLIPDGSTLRMQIDYRTDTSLYAGKIYLDSTQNIVVNTFDWDSTSGSLSAITDTSGTMDSGLSGYAEPDRWYQPASKYWWWNSTPSNMVTFAVGFYIMFISGDQGSGAIVADWHNDNEHWLGRMNDYKFQILGNGGMDMLGEAMGDNEIHYISVARNGGNWKMKMDMDHEYTGSHSGQYGFSVNNYYSAGSNRPNGKWVMANFIIASGVYDYINPPTA